MRDFLIGVAGLVVGWWACELRIRRPERQRFTSLRVAEPPSNVVSIWSSDGDGLIA